MMNGFFVAINDIELLVNDSNVSRQNIRCTPERLTQTVEVGFSVSEVSKTLGMGEKLPLMYLIIAYFIFNYFHKSKVSFNRRTCYG